MSRENIQDSGVEFDFIIGEHFRYCVVHFVCTGRGLVLFFGAIERRIVALNAFHFISINRMDLLAHSLLWFLPEFEH
jgi:hypothetical protein